MYDSKNGINHKCPCCGYEVEWNWGRKGEESNFVKGDESFIVIENNVGKTTTFETDKPRHVSWGPEATEKVSLLGCPKCHAISFKVGR